MHYELRTYIAPPGRLEAIVDRFRTRTMAIFARHGFDVVGFWTVDAETEAGEGPRPGDEAGSTEGRELVYLLRWPSRQACEQAWAAFRQDPEWIETRRITEADGPIVETIVDQHLTPTDFSPLS